MQTTIQNISFASRRCFSSHGWRHCCDVEDLTSTRVPCVAGQEQRVLRHLELVRVLTCGRLRGRQAASWLVCLHHYWLIPSLYIFFFISIAGSLVGCFESWIGLLKHWDRKVLVQSSGLVEKIVIFGGVRPAAKRCETMWPHALCPTGLISCTHQIKLVADTRFHLNHYIE